MTSKRFLASRRKPTWRNAVPTAIMFLYSDPGQFFTRQVTPLCASIRAKPAVEIIQQMRRKSNDDDEHRDTRVRTSQDQHRPVAVGQSGHRGSGLLQGRLWRSRAVPPGG